MAQKVAGLEPNAVGKARKKISEIEEFHSKVLEGIAWSLFSEIKLRNDIDEQ